MGEESNSFPVTNGVKEGCVLSPTLFSMMFSAMLTDGFHGCDYIIHILHRSEGRLVNPGRLRAVTKLKETINRDFLFAND